jgi:Histidine-specific methyltransferase, SAM-dependent
MAPTASQAIVAAPPKASKSIQRATSPPHVPETNQNHEISNIIDIRRDGPDFDLVKDIYTLLQPGEGKEKRMPTMLLYDAAGLKLFEDITYTKDYYLTNAEIQVLKENSNELAEQIAPGSMVIELGSGYVFASRLRDYNVA